MARTWSIYSQNFGYTKALVSFPEKFRIVKSVWTIVPIEERTITFALRRSAFKTCGSKASSPGSTWTAFSALTSKGKPFPSVGQGDVQFSWW